MAKAEKFWDFLANNFDQGEGDPAERQDIKITKKYLQLSDVVLDYACGIGTLSIEIAHQVKVIHAVDISSKMLATVARKATERKIDNIRLEHTTIFDERFTQESFDAVLAFNILHLLEDAQQAVQRINALLRPGGYFISSTPSLAEKKSFVNHLISPLFIVPSKLRIIPYVKLFKISELESLFAHGNFQLVETKKFVAGLTDYFVVARKINTP